MSKRCINIFATPTDFAEFGKQAFAYMRPVRSDDMNTTFPQHNQLPPGLHLWGLFAANGEPLALADEPELLMQSAGELDLMPFTRH